MVPAALAQQVSIVGIKVLEEGFYTANETGETKPAPAGVNGKVTQQANWHFLKEAPPARIGSNVGVRYQLIGSPQGANVKLKFVWKIPAPGVTDPQSHKTYRESTSDRIVAVGNTYLNGYGFDHQWEIVRGDWVMEIWYGERKLTEKTFTIQ
jgi:hypothetical protein